MGRAASDRCGMMGDMVWVSGRCRMRCKRIAAPSIAQQIVRVGGYSTRRMLAPSANSFCSSSA
jgi:hypothetical protein